MKLRLLLRQTFFSTICVSFSALSTYGVSVLLQRFCDFSVVAFVDGGQSLVVVVTSIVDSCLLLVGIG